MLLETERLRLRTFTPADLDAYHCVIYGDAAVMLYLPGGRPRSRERTLEVLNFALAHEQAHGYSLWAVEALSSGAFMGHCGLLRLKESGEVEVAYAFGKTYWGQGYASEAARACVRYGFESAGLAFIVALAVPANLASQRVMEKAGLRAQGFSERYYNTTLALYQLDRADWRADGAPYRLLHAP